VTDSTGGTGDSPSVGGSVASSAGGSGEIPGAFANQVTIEENDRAQCAVDGVMESTHSGFTGDGYLNSDNYVGARIEWEVNVGEAGTYSLTIAYSNEPAADRPGDVLVDGVVVATGLAFPSTGSWTSYSDATVDVTLAVGENRIVLRAAEATGLANIDSLTVTGAAVAPGNCDETAATGGQGSGGPATGGQGPHGNEGDYYVAVDGSDENPGTMDEPFATMQHAIDVAEAGELVFVRGGVYEIVDGAQPSMGIHFYKSGKSNAERIRYFAYPGEKPVFEFKNLKIQPDPNYTSGVYTDGAWLHLKGFEIRNVPMNTRSNTGLSVGGGAHHNIFEQLDIHHIFGSGMFIHTTTGGHEIINCDSHDNYDPHSHQGNGENADGFGVHYQKTGDVTVFRGCRAWWNSDDGWDFISQEVPVIVENSWAMGHGYINSGTDKAGNGNGFKIGSSKTGIRHIVRNNVAWGNRASGFYANHSSGGNDWFNNTAYNNGTQFNMWASTWDSAGNRTDGVSLTGDKAHVMRNNIGFPHKNAYIDGYGVDSQFNTWDLGITPSNAHFVSVSADDFTQPRKPDGSLPVLDFMRLSQGSPMVDAGIDVGLPFVGSAPDLGAYEQ